MMMKTVAYFHKNSTSFTRAVFKNGPRIYFNNRTGSYDVYTFKNSKPAHLPRDVFRTLNGDLDKIVSQLTDEFEGKS